MNLVHAEVEKSTKNAAFHLKHDNRMTDLASS